MINSKEDYIFYLHADEIALDIDKTWPNMVIAYFFNDIWHFQRLLRKFEYYKNCKGFFLWKPYLLYLSYRVRSSGQKLGFEIPPNVFGRVLALPILALLLLMAMSVLVKIVGFIPVSPGNAGNR